MALLSRILAFQDLSLLDVSCTASTVDLCSEPVLGGFFDHRGELPCAAHELAAHEDQRHQSTFLVFGRVEMLEHFFLIWVIIRLLCVRVAVLVLLVLGAGTLDLKQNVQEEPIELLGTIRKEKLQASQELVHFPCAEQWCNKVLNPLDEYLVVTFEVKCPRVHYLIQIAHHDCFGFEVTFHCILKLGLEFFWPWGTGEVLHLRIDPLVNQVQAFALQFLGALEFVVV